MTETPIDPKVSLVEMHREAREKLHAARYEVDRWTWYIKALEQISPDPPKRKRYRSDRPKAVVMAEEAASALAAAEAIALSIKSTWSVQNRADIGRLLELRGHEIWGDGPSSVDHQRIMRAIVLERTGAVPEMPTVKPYPWQVAPEAQP